MGMGYGVIHTLNQLINVCDELLMLLVGMLMMLMLMAMATGMPATRTVTTMTWSIRWTTA